MKNIQQENQIRKDGMIVSGVGAIFLSTFRYHNQSIPMTYLALERYNELSDFGGKYKKSTFHTLKSEVYEESAKSVLITIHKNHFHINKQRIRQEDVYMLDFPVSNTKLYRVFVFFVPPKTYKKIFSTRDFYHHKKLLQRRREPKEFYEIKQTYHVPLRNIYKSIKNNKFKVKTLHGNVFKLRKRTRDIFKALFS